jgi:hypothetical protein
LGGKNVKAHRSHFATACPSAFRRLVDTFGFSEPEIESIGRETFVRYHRGDQTISIAHEAGSAPLVELFYPSAETGERPVPWAERNGVPRSRRIPHLGVTENCIEADPRSMSLYLAANARALERVERNFLAASREGAEQAGT